MQCTFVLLICNVWRRFYFCTHPVRHNFKCEVFLWLMCKKNKQTLEYKCVYLVSLLLCVFLWPIKCFGDDKYSRYPFTLLLIESTRGGERALRIFDLVFMLFLFLRSLVKLLLEIHLGKSHLASSWRLWLRVSPTQFLFRCHVEFKKKKCWCEPHCASNH